MLRLGIIGCGNVGKAFLKVCQNQGLPIEVIGVARRAQQAVNPGGLSLDGLFDGGLEHLAKLDKAELPQGDDPKTKWEFIRKLEQLGANTLLELIPSDGKGEPGDSYINWALNLGLNVITADKYPVAYGLENYLKTATRQKVGFRYSTTVLAGDCPLLRWAWAERPEIIQIRAALNATSNWILTKMLESGLSFQDSLKAAQSDKPELAEADPSRDISGADTAVKLSILSRLMGGKLKPEEIAVEGIEKVTLQELRWAQEQGCWVHLLGRLWQEEGRVKGEVFPVTLPQPWSQVRGTDMAIEITPAIYPNQPYFDHLRGVTIAKTARGLWLDLLSLEQ